MVQWGLGGGCFRGGLLWISFMEEEEDRLQKRRGWAWGY